MAHKISSSRRPNQIVVGDRGRLVLPARVRKNLGIEKGTRLQLKEEADGSLTLRPYAAIVEATRGMFADIKPHGVSVVDELIAERREEAKREGQRYADPK